MYNTLSHTCHVTDCHVTHRGQRLQAVGERLGCHSCKVQVTQVAGGCRDSKIVMATKFPQILQSLCETLLHLLEHRAACGEGCPIRAHPGEGGEGVPLLCVKVQLCCQEEGNGM